VPMVTRVGMDLSQFRTTISLRQGDTTRCAALPMFDAMGVLTAGPICRDEGDKSRPDQDLSPTPGDFPKPRPVGPRPR
jgi:hypothetical protein